ncbi:hypothetical protein AB0B89_22640, partial [Sphaerisporangium sp. NPDC049002]|uniref:hypothetical protein n=1 Tax=Sphaerisporangium sp. NPDC049002 TaxID=3155392 RepID=UPI003406C9F1
MIIYRLITCVRKGEQPPWVIPDELWARIEPLLPVLPLLATPHPLIVPIGLLMAVGPARPHSRDLSTSISQPGANGS